VEWKDFSATIRKTKLKSSTGKIIEVTVQRDILGFLAAKSQELNSPVNIDEALKFPLSPIPLHMQMVQKGRQTKVLYLMQLSFLLFLL
jgi:hypothetical protein